ncbi:uncharacterized protein LOC123529503 [Mercenaria mercenaria]|uniref:uncharacterized protein LOC123529503 n=1 Tax=Mercenaria mercenaria TaxID=6596 RepID=UPI00234F155F|nr:uncharacterized protein LOC123529503 [Mercenaria mercenaria]XP_045165795.2 uncharacterized protein LOC123529503 [Mercenaria mercenaria]XP_045165796.2 uncharacterized protein LOC123529503 [Mercenaria mercenaria]
MTTIRAVTFSLLLLVCTANACNDADDIFPCTCSLNADKIEVDCSGYGLRSVPESLPEQTAVLDFSDNLLQPDSIETLCEHGFLEHVSIAGNHLTSIEPRRLRKCDISESLNFSGNLFDVVDKYTLYGLEFTHEFHGLEAREFKENSFTDMFGLKTLEILMHQSRIPDTLFKNNHIRQLKINVNGATEIPESLLSPLNATLSGLTITSPSVQSLPAKLLSNLKKLKMCTLEVNELHSIPSTFFQEKILHDTVENITLLGIKSLPRHVFRLLGNLRHLEIHGAVDMPSDLFHGLLGLEFLDLSTSAISAIPIRWFGDLWSLQTLILHDAGITLLRKDDFEALHALNKIDLSKNRLRSLEPELFYHISGSANFINISENILKTVPGKLFKQHAVLECLDISKNQIYSIENGAFYHLPELKRLHLQSNKLYHLEAATFIYNVYMTYLDMSSNILFDLPGGLFGSTHRLLVFNLSDNRLNNLERSITFNVPTLREINLSYNPIECDCGIEAVKKLLLNVLIIGDCEKPQAGISIVDFVPDANCLWNSATDSLVTRFISSTDFLYPSESKIEEWESKLIISANDAVSKTRHESKLLTVAITATNVSYSNRELSASRINNFTIFNNQSSKIKLNDLPITKHDVSRSDTAVFIKASFTPTPGYSSSAWEIKKSTKVIKNEPQVYSSDIFGDFKVNQTQTDGRNSKLLNLTLPFVSVSYKTDTVSSATTYTLKIEQETYYEGTSYHLTPPDASLEPSFKTVSAASYTDNGIHLTETLFETLQTKSVLSENGALNSADVESFSPTSVFYTVQDDDKTMTEGFHTLGEPTETSPNGTVLPPVVAYENITGNPEMAGKGEKSEYFYLSLASIVSVAVFSVLILVFLYYKRRRNSEYEVGRRDTNVYNIDNSFYEDGRVSQSASLCPMKEVPSIQIESVDDEGNVKLEFYPVSETQ